MWDKIMQNIIEMIDSMLPPMPILGVIAVWVAMFLLRKGQMKAVKAFFEEIEKRDLSAAERINEVENYIKRHPFIFEKSQLLLWIMPDLLAEGEDLMKRIGIINVKDIHPSLHQFSVYVLHLLKENGRAEEYSALKKKLDKIRHTAIGLDEAMKAIDVGSVEGIPSFVTDGEAPYLNVIYYYYRSADENKKGNTEEALRYSDMANKAIPEKVMRAVTNRRNDSYEIGN